MHRRSENLAVIGMQWGDEGKGKLVDLLSPNFRHAVRFQGGDNAGHTVVVDGRSMALHQVPCGAMHPDSFLVVGSGVVLNLEVLHQELYGLRAKGIDVLGRLLLSERAHLVLPYHIAIDRRREAGSAPIGTTGRGIGPAYESKAARLGIRLGDLKSPSSMLDKVSALHSWAYPMVGAGVALPDPEAVIERLMELASPLMGNIGDAQEHLHRAWDSGEPILFEGAQATMLDLDHGTYPYVTSSNCSVGGLFSGTGLPHKALHKVLGVAKAYTTRVGSGPFPSELGDPMAERIRAAGREFGTTTGRPRRCGWFDAVILRHTCRLNGVDGIGVMKLDVLDGLEKIGLVKTYRGKDGRPLASPPSSADGWQSAAPVTEYFEGWPNPTKGITEWGNLPRQAQDYLMAIEGSAGVPIVYVGTGPDRQEGILVQGSFLEGMLGATKF